MNKVEECPFRDKYNCETDGIYDVNSKICEYCLLRKKHKCNEPELGYDLYDPFDSRPPSF